MNRSLKKNIFGKTQNASVQFAGGFSQLVYRQIQNLLENPYHPTKESPEIIEKGSEIYLNHSHIFTLMEILFRLNCISDIKINLANATFQNPQELLKSIQKIHYPLFFPEKSSIYLKIHFHPMFASMQEKVLETFHQSLTSQDTSFNLEINIYKDRLWVSTSLAGEPLYKRGFRTTLSASAPLREDIAFSCIDQFFYSLQEKQIAFQPTVAYIPFSGTGTFLFEYMAYQFQLSPILYSRNFAMENFSFFKKETMDFCQKRAIQNIDKNKQIQVVCQDHNHSANQSFQENLSSFLTILEKNNIPFLPDTISLLESDFFQTDMHQLFIHQAIFLPLNPPYGIRFSNGSSDMSGLYAGIAKKIVELAKTNQVGGFILCPNESTWKFFLKELKGFTSFTYHLTQGGIDIRCCNFIKEI